MHHSNQLPGNTPEASNKATQSSHQLERQTESLHQRNFHFEALINEAPLGIYLLDESLRIRQANLAALELLSDDQNLIGRDFEAVIRTVWAESYANEIVRRIRTTLATGEAYFSTTHIEPGLDPGATECFAWQINRVLLQDGSQGVVCYFRDISDQVVAREAIAESKLQRRRAAEGLRAIAARARCLLWYADVEDRGDRTLHWNLRVADEEAARRFLPLDMPAGHDHGRAIAEARLPEDRARMIWGDDEIRAGRSYQQEFRVRDVDGNVRWLCEDVQIEAVGPNLWYAVGICVDITERKRAEEERANHLAEIETLNSRLQLAMAETHHRVKNNLQVISALVDMQNMKHEESVPAAELHRIGQHIRALATIHDLLTAHAKTDSDTECLQTSEIMNRLLPLLQGLAQGRRVSVQTQDIALPMRHGTSLAVLVNELVSNAVKHGGGQINVTLTAEKGLAQLEVCDDGPGFPEGFEPQKAANTGLELIDTLSRLDLRGTTTFHNRPQGGACVTVEFPLPSQPAP
jgi:two-component sensor histidine kinase/PAS domain-containing protein